MAPIPTKSQPGKRRALFGVFFTLLIILTPMVAAACGHWYYESRRAKTCQEKTVGYWEIWDVRDCCSSCQTGSCCSCYRCDEHIRTCDAWQIAVTAHTSGQSGDWGVCQCKKECLESPYENSGNPQYFNDPINKTTQNPSNIKLPVVFSWKQISGWKNDGKFAIDEAPNVNFGPQSYRVEIQDTTTQNGIDNFNFAAESSDDTSPNKEYAKRKNSERIETIGGKMAYYKVVGTNAWNSVTDAWPCFFNSNGKYRWRVRPCCDAFGADCKEFGDDEGWWYFSVSTAPELISPSDTDWNGAGPYKNTAAEISFKDIREGVNPLKWCSAKLPDELQTEGLPTKYAGSYQLYVTSNEDNDVVNGIQGIINSVTSAYNNLKNWIYGVSSGQTEAEENQKTHALSVINGQIISDVFPNPTTGDVETWYPAQARGDLAYFSRNRSYTWMLKTCPNEATRDEFEDKENNDDCYEDSSQQWKFITIDEKIPAPEPISPKDDSSGEEPVGFPISITWSIPAGANSFQFNTDIGNFTGNRPTTWSTIPNKETQAVDPNAMTLNDPAIKLNTAYHWKVRSCAMFDSGKKNPGDCDDWSKEYSFVTTGRPPKTDTMKPDLGTTITFPQNFTWENVGGAKAYIIELYDSNYRKIAAQTVQYDSNQENPPTAQFGYPNITQPAEGTANTTYHWRVQTCADSETKHCGDPSEYQNFTIYRIAAPTLTSDEDEFGSLRDLNLEWNSRTKDNLVLITYSGGSPQEGCLTGGSIANFKSSDGTCTFTNGCVDQNVSTGCAGTYSYTIYPCVDINCSDRGDALTGTFKIKATGTSSGWGNFQVCGQNTDNLDTKWKETDECTIGSFFLVVKMIINFLLFKLAFMILPVLALISGGMFYLGMNGKDTIPTIKKMWKYAGIGYALMFMAWLLVSWLLAAIGFNAIHWYQVF